MSIRVISTVCCSLVLFAGVMFGQESSKPQQRSTCATGKKTGCCLDSSICNKTQYCDDNCQCTRKKPAAISEAEIQSASVSPAKEARTDYSDPVVSTTTVVGVAFQSARKLRFLTADAINLDRLDAPFFEEDCGVDKGKCSSGSYCCRYGGSGWCCPNGKKCDYDNYGCK